MSILQNGTIQCDWCGKFCAWDDTDSYTIYGAVYPSIDDGPEPHDPVHLCGKCSEELYEQYLNKFKNGNRDGDWMKSNAERRAAKECGLVWVSNSTLVHRKTGHEAFNCYVLETERPFYH